MYAHVEVREHKTLLSISTTWVLGIWTHRSRLWCQAPLLTVLVASTVTEPSSQSRGSELYVGPISLASEAPARGLTICLSRDHKDIHFFTWHRRFPVIIITPSRIQLLLAAVWYWASYIISLNLCFALCGQGDKWSATPQSYWNEALSNKTGSIANLNWVLLMCQALRWAPDKHLLPPSTPP